VKLSLKELT